MKWIILGLVIALVLSGCVQDAPKEQEIQTETTPEETTEAKLTLGEAIQIAENSECTQEGKLTDKYMYNEFTKTWWIDLELEKKGCYPACVVNEATETAEINWRCTGALPPQ